MQPFHLYVNIFFMHTGIQRSIFRHMKSFADSESTPRLRRASILHIMNVILKSLLLTFPFMSTRVVILKAVPAIINKIS